MIRKFFRFIFSLFFWICAFVGFLIIALVLSLILASGSFFKASDKTLKNPSVLTLTLDGTHVEHTDEKGLGALFLGKKASLYNLTRAIHHAAHDDKIKGLLIRLETPKLGAAQTQELRDALLAFRKSGKPSWCYTDTFGEMSSGTKLYYLATGCDEIWVQPIGTVNLTGLSVQQPFGKEALEKLGVQPELAHRKEYKSYVEMFTHEDFSKPSRDALQAVMDSILSQLVDGIAKARKLSHDQVRHLINNGPYLLGEIKQANLIDRIDYRYNLKPYIQQKLGPAITFVGLSSYLDTLPSKTKGDKVALIFGSGKIARDGEGSLLDDLKITSNSTYKTFEKVMKDKEVKAIVYRINSTGGSPIASESIASLIEDVQEKTGKPVIISMSDAAASGGYLISSVGAKIVAQPATLTGSIGAFGGKFVPTELFDKLGVKWREISTSDNASMWSINESYTPAQWIKINALMDEIYESFVARVSKGRKMTIEQVEKVARGRVWTGEQALALNLVDQLGDLQAAIALAREEANLPPHAGVQVYPLRKNLMEVLFDLFEENDEEPLYSAGLLGSFLTPVKRISAVFEMLISSEKVFLDTPLVEVE